MSEFDPDEVTELSDEDQAAAHAEMLARRAKAADEDMAFVMSSKQGRRFVATLLSAYPFNRLSYRDGCDAIGMAFREGERSVCAGLVTDVIRVCPNSYWLMTTEQHEGK